MIHNLTALLLTQTPGILCLERDFILCEHPSFIPYVQEGFRSEMLMIFYCVEGTLHACVGDEAVSLSAGDAFLCRPLSTIHGLRTSLLSRVSILFFSPQSLEHLLPANSNLSQILDSGLPPLVHTGREYMAQHLSPLLDTLSQHLRDAHLSFRSNTLYHLFCLLLFEVLNCLCAVGVPSITQEEAPLVSRADTHFNQFVRLLNEDRGRHRTVTYYADLLCITPKHLSKVIKRKTSTRALEYINRHAMHQIKLDLKLTDIPISLLADKYNFTNFSFFCQYVKSHLGVSPQEYRREG